MTRHARHGSLRTEAYQRLRENILRGLYTRGAALTEQQVAQELGVSRTPVREAFSQLELDGLVSSIPNKGVVVQGLDEIDIQDLFEVRSQMETIAASRAARQMSDSQRQALRDAYERERQCTASHEDVSRLQDLDSEFHDLIFKGTGSKILIKMLSSINIFTRQARSISLATPGRSEQVLDEHGLILDAIFCKDCESARQRMAEHIKHASASFMAANKKGGQKHVG